MRLRGVLLAAVLGGFAGGCAFLQFPEVGLSPPVPRQNASARIAGGFITISNPSLTCGGSYNAGEASSSFSMPVQCTDGRRGSAAITRSASGVDGAGRLVLDDGAEADFAFGNPTGSVPTAPRLNMWFPR